MTTILALPSFNSQIYNAQTQFLDLEEVLMVICTEGYPDDVSSSAYQLNTPTISEIYTGIKRSRDNDVSGIAYQLNHFTISELYTFFLPLKLYYIRHVELKQYIEKVTIFVTELPLEPSLARTLIEANEYGCLPQALSVAAMLSVEGTLLPGRSKNTEKKKRKIILFQNFQMVLVGVITFSSFRSLSYGLNLTIVLSGLKIPTYGYYYIFVRGMLFVKDVRKQLSQIMQKVAKERIMRHNTYRTLGFKPQLVQICIVILLCLEQWWIQPVSESSGGPKKAIKNGGPLDDSNTRIQVAQDRFLSRKGNK
ncbi:hypothetical protein LXL04_005721 [Taraxacum kok-saghyz]